MMAADDLAGGTTLFIANAAAVRDEHIAGLGQLIGLADERRVKNLRSRAAVTPDLANGSGFRIDRILHRAAVAFLNCRGWLWG